MKLLPRLRHFSLLALCWVLFHPAQAAIPHVGQLTYTYVSTAASGEQTYRVRAQVVSTCEGLALPNTLPLTASAGCGPALRTATLNLVGGPTIIPTYCPQIQALACLASPPPGVVPVLGFEENRYEGTIALPPAAAWTLSAELAGRHAAANLAGRGTLHLEATLNSLITPLSGPAIVVTNNSPEPSAVHAQVVAVIERRDHTITFAATDADRTNGRGDSLVYSLERPLNGCNTLTPAALYPIPCLTDLDPFCPFRTIDCANISSHYTAGLPVAVLADTIYENGSTIRPPCPVSTITRRTQVQPRFTFSQPTGSFRFTPTSAQAGSAATGVNQYVVVGKITEYRRLNGQYYEVGSMRREFLVLVLPASIAPASIPPTIVVPTGQNISRNGDTLEVTAYTCQYTRFRFGARLVTTPGVPPGAGPSMLNIAYSANVNGNLLQSGAIGQLTLTDNNTNFPQITLLLQPISGVAGTTVIIPLRIEDDNCPNRGVSFLIVRLRLLANPAPLQVQAAGQALPYAVVCPGTIVPLAGLSLRPDSVLTATGRQRQQYAYQWRVAPGYNAAAAGLPAVTNTPAISVAPTATTRYLLTADPMQGFVPGFCTDTASVVVYVVGPAPLITRQGNTLTSSYPAGNQWYLNGNLIPGATGQTHVATTTGSYTVVVTAGSGASCFTPPSTPLMLRSLLNNGSALAGTSLSVAPNPTADGRVRVELTGYLQAATLSVFDLLGRQVQQATISAPNPAGTVRELDLSAQPTGVYLLRVQTPGGLDVRRIVRQ